jgi:quercetin dioxygenase-like cupin family protein
MRALSIPCLVVLLAGCGPAQQEAPEPAAEPTAAATATPAPEGATVLLDGTYATVMRFELQPGQAQARHEGLDRAVYSLGDYTLKWTEGDAEPVETAWTAGDAHWHAAGPHAAENVGDDVARYLVIARTAEPLPAVEGEVEPDVAAAGTDHAKVLLENESVRVVEVALEPGEATPRHQGGHRVIYALGDYSIRWTEGEAEPKDVTWTAGEAHWHGPAEHSVENVGESPARYLVVTFLN